MELVGSKLEAVRYANILPSIFSVAGDPCKRTKQYQYKSYKFLNKMVDPMTIVHLLGRHGGRYVVYDDEGKIVLMTRNKKIALNYLPYNEAA